MERITLFYKTPSENIHLVNLNNIILKHNIKNKAYEGLQGYKIEKYISFTLPFKNIHTNKIYIDFDRYKETKENENFNFTISLLDYFVYGTYTQVIKKEQALKDNLKVFTVIDIEKIITRNPNNNYLKITGV